MKKKILLITMFVLSLALLVAVGTTLAWLIDTSGPVENIFKPSNIDVELKENTGNTYKMIPGTTLAKNPTVTVTNDIDCYVFVEVTKTNDPDKYLTYEIAEGWTLVQGTTYVYYREVSADAQEKTFAVLDGNVVTVKKEVTKEMMDNLDDANGAFPKLEFNAYAIQKTSGTDANGNATTFTPQSAWAEISGANN